MKNSVVTMASALPWCALPLSETETVCPEALPRAIEPLSKPREDTNINRRPAGAADLLQRLLRAEAATISPAGFLLEKEA
jgi:hypothetical protein